MRFSRLLMAATASLAVNILAVNALAVPALADDSAGFQAGSILLRARVIDVSPDVSSTVSVVNGSVSISDNTVPEFDATYFFTPNLSAELIAAVTYHSLKDNGSIAGNLPLGSVRLLPPTLTAQWHFMPESAFSPYVGAGLNYTFFYGVKHNKIPGVIYSEHYANNAGGALQAGADFRLSGRWYANIDVKKIFLSTDWDAGTAVGHVHASVDINPWIVGAGIGYRF